MNEVTTETDRRKHRRYTTAENVFVVLNERRIFNFGKPTKIMLGPIADISIGGLSVQYIDNGLRAADLNRLSISKESYEIFPEGIPFNIVSDFIVDNISDSMDKRKRCIEFGKLSMKQLAQLHEFISKYTTKANENE